MASEIVSSETDEALRIKRDLYGVVAFFALISVIGSPVGVYLGYRAWKYHQKLS